MPRRFWSCDLATLALALAVSAAACSDSGGPHGDHDAGRDDGGQDGGHYLLSLTVEGGGTVTSEPAGLDCGDGGDVCELEIPVGASARLFADVAEHHHLGTWGISGDVCPTSLATCDVAPQGDLALMVEFPIDTFAINVAGDGDLVVTSTPAGIDCGSACTAEFAYGTQVTLGVGDVLFGRWSGACDGVIGDCTLEVTEQLDVGIFDRRPRISEVLFDVPGTDGDNQFVELDCEPGASLAGYLTIIDGDAADAGEVLSSQTLDGIDCGSAGFVILQRGDVYAGASGVTYVDGFFTDELQNGSQTYAITATAMTVGSDVDTDDDGALDLPLPEVISGIGVIDNNSADRGYVTPTFRLSDNSGAFARFAGTSGEVAGDWFYGVVEANPNPPPTFLYGAQVSNNFPAGAALTPGTPNAQR